MDQFKKLVSDYNFISVGEITTRIKNSRNGDYLAPNFYFSLNYLNDIRTIEHGWIYLWVLSSASGSAQVCYVGKAGKTLKKRCAEHVNGARTIRSGSTTGRKNVDKMKEFLDEAHGNKINIYVRKSNYKNVLDEKMCLYSIEEEAVIQKCRKLGFNLWNK